MFNDIKAATFDFIENEKKALISTVTNIDENSYEQAQIHEDCNIAECVNDKLVNERELRRTNERLIETSEIRIRANSKTDFSGVSPKRYTTTCYIKPKTYPYWYTESVLLFINSTKKKYEDKVFFKEKLVPIKWSERMTTEVSILPNQQFYASMEIPVSDIYIPLEAAVA